VAHCKWLIPQLSSRLLQPFWSYVHAVAKHTAGHAEMPKMKLPAKPCFLSVPYESPLSLWPWQKGLCSPMMLDAVEFLQD